MAKKSPASTPADIAVLPTTTAMQPRQDDGVSIFERLANSNTTPENMDKLITMYERLEAMKARKAFDASMALAHAELKTINKGRTVDFTSNKGRTNYKYEDLGQVIQALAPLASHGFSWRWRTNSDKPGLIAVTCILSHALGHSEETTLTCQSDVSGNKNDIQAIGSAVTYLQRYTLKAACGVAASVDDDAQSFHRKDDEPVSRQRDDAPAEKKKYTTDPNDTRLISTKNRDQAPGDKKIGGQLLRLHTLVGKSKRTDEEIKAYLLTFGFKSSKEITRNKYDEICDAVMAPGPLQPGQSDETGYDPDAEPGIGAAEYE